MPGPKPASLAMKTKQNPSEFSWFLDILRRENVRSYLEIGSYQGGSALQVAHALIVPSLIVMVDSEPRDELDDALKTIVAMGHRGKLVSGNSQMSKTVEFVKKFGQFDCVFIDGDHSTAGVTADWQNYSPLAKMVAMHDISHEPKDGKTAIETKAFWLSVRQEPFVEIRFQQRHNGIGVLWNDRARFVNG
jgi:predicted O-methyltransferase YrrM